MALLRYLGAASVVLGVAFAACSEDAGETEPPDPTTSTGTTTTGVGGSTSSTSSTGGSGGEAPLTCNVPYTNIEGECDLLNQDCPQGQWCDVAGSGDTATLICKPHFGGLKSAGDDCDQTSECGVGMRCIDLKCSPFCCPETDQPCAGGTCDVHMSVGGTSAFVMFCSYNETCDLFSDGCEGDEIDCHLIDVDTGLAVCDGRSSNWVEEGGVCIYRNDCGDSQFCHSGPPDGDPDAGINGRCRHLCLVSDWQNLQPGFGGCSQTPVPQTCHDAGASAMPDLGVCIPD